MKYFVVVLPTDKDKAVNRQILEFEDYESAKQSFHFNCGKYFKNDSLLKASVCILDDLCNQIEHDSWDSTLPKAQEQATE